MTDKENEKVINDGWDAFIFKLLTRKKANRRFIIPTDYLWSLADKIHQINPTKAIIFNTLKEVYGVATDRAYQKSIEDAKFFKDKQEKHIKESFDALQDRIDDEIHNKPTQTK